MVPGWEDIEEKPGFDGVRAVVERDVVPLFEKLPDEIRDKHGAPKHLERVMSLAMGLFLATYLPFFFFLPAGSLGGVLRFVLFLPLFAASVALVIFLNRKKILAFLARGAERALARHRAVATICGSLGLSYDSAPGGVPEPVLWLARQSWGPPELKQMAESLNARGETDAAVEIARKSGIMEPLVMVAGTQEQRDEYRERMARNMTVEDGFHGVRNGVGFDVFEWVESVSEAPDIYHLVVVLKAPVRLHGTTELRARKLGWTFTPNRVPMTDVDLGPKAFHDLYRLRGTDQVEARTLFNPAVIERVIALAHGGKFRGIASEDYLVFDVSGENRFIFLDVASGDWSDETIRKGLSDLAEALDLVDALVHAFMVKATPVP